MANRTEEFKKLWIKKEIDSNMLVPLMTWCSGSNKNIENVQTINKLFKYVDKTVLSHHLSLNNKSNHFFKYPKVEKEDEKTKFFYDDLRKYLKLSKHEFQQNIGVIDIEAFKEKIATIFGYENNERRLIGLKKR